MLPLHDRIGLSPAEYAHLMHLCGPLRTLEDVLRASLAWTPQPALVEVVTQDEFTSDVIFALGADRYLVFDTT